MPNKQQPTPLTNWQEQAKGTVNYSTTELTGGGGGVILPADYISWKEHINLMEAQALATAEQLRHVWLKEGEEAALAAVVKWGNEECPHVHKVLPNRPRHACDICWASLEQEAIEEKGK